MKKAIFLSLSLSIATVCAELTSTDVRSIEDILNKYKFESKLTDAQSFSLNATVAMELKQYGYKDKATEYFKKAIELADKAPKKSEKYDLYTEYLFHLVKTNEAQAKTFYEKTYKPTLEKSSYEKKDGLLSFWSNHFSKDPKINQPFFNQYYKDKKIKSLIEEKKYSEAYKIIEGADLKEANINSQLEFDVLSTLNHKKGKLYCLNMLNEYPESYAITVETCRYLKDRKLKFGTLQALEKRTKEEQPQLLYIVKALKDIK